VEKEPTKPAVTSNNEAELDARAAKVANQLLTVTAKAVLWTTITEEAFKLTGEFSKCKAAQCDGDDPQSLPVALETGASRVLSRLRKQIINHPPTWQHVLIKTFPHSTIGRLSMGCTATLIAPRVLVTAAHCVVKNNIVQPAASVKFAAIQDGPDDKPYGEKTATRIYVPRGYIDTNGEREDWAYIILESAFHINLGYLGFAKYDGPGPLQVRIAGYPRSKNKQMWESECQMTFLRKGRILHKCDTEPGHSGSTIRELAAGKAVLVRAIHDGALGATDNYGYPIQDDAFKQFRLARAVNRLDTLPANHQEEPGLVDSIRLIYSSIFG